MCRLWPYKASSARLASVLAGLALAPIAARAAWADHGVGGSGGAGIGAGWFFLAGALVATGLAAWAMFAPEREESGDDEPPR